VVKFLKHKNKYITRFCAALCAAALCSVYAAPAAALFSDAVYYGDPAHGSRRGSDTVSGRNGDGLLDPISIIEGGQDAGLDATEAADPTEPSGNGGGADAAGNGGGADSAGDGGKGTAGGETGNVRKQLKAGSFSYVTEEDGSVTITAYDGLAEKLTIPDSIGGSRVTGIGEGAFRKCASLSNVVVPAGVVRIGASAFSGDTELQRVDLPEGLREIGEEAFYDCGLTVLELPASVISIGKYAFDSCSALTHVSLPSGISEISEGAFMNCSKLTEILFPENISNIGSFAFFGCSGLSELEFPDRVSVISAGAFAGCASLSQVQLPPALSSLGRHAFAACRSLRSVIFGGDDRVNTAALTIDTGAFYGCSSLKEVVLPLTGSEADNHSAKSASVTIGTEVFRDCADLRHINIAPGVTAIGSDAFLNSAVDTLFIPDSVDSMGNIFNDVRNLTDIYYEGNGSQWSDLCGAADAEPPANVEMHYKTDAPEWPELLALDSFVDRMYRNFFGYTGSWDKIYQISDGLYDGAITGSEAIYNFVYSKEVQDKSLSDDEFVKAMYGTIFGRQPDKKGLAAWTELLAAGCTRKLVLSGLLGSNEMFRLCDELKIEAGTYSSDEIVDRKPSVTMFVSRMYQYCLGREADDDGLASWVSVILNSRASGTSVAESFLYSPELARMELTNREYVRNVYFALFGREPDSKGLENWTRVLDEGRNRTEVILGLLNSPEFEQLCSDFGISVR
jgi:hypothetical protein